MSKDIQELDCKEEWGQFSFEGGSRKQILKNLMFRKIREEEIKWKQRSRCKWLSEGNKITKIFHGMASLRNRGSKISVLVDGNNRLKNREDIIEHIVQFLNSCTPKVIGFVLIWTTWNLVS